MPHAFLCHRVPPWWSQMIRTRVAWIIADFRFFFDLMLVVYYVRKILFTLDNGTSSINSNIFGEACNRPARY